MRSIRTSGSIIKCWTKALRKEFSFDLERQRGGGGGTDEVEIASSSTPDDENTNNVLQLLTSHAGRSRAMGGRVLELQNAARDGERCGNSNWMSTGIELFAKLARDDFRHELCGGEFTRSRYGDERSSRFGRKRGWSHWRFFCHLVRYGCHRCRSLGRFYSSEQIHVHPVAFRRRQTRKTRARVKSVGYVLVNLDNLDDVLRRRRY